MRKTYVTPEETRKRKILGIRFLKEVYPSLRGLLKFNCCRRPFPTSFLFPRGMNVYEMKIISRPMDRK